ncbi:hypothetical protein GGP91_003223 [Salinibacter ruber]|uniref:restriction endonuclease PLD domain-containing protein n=1 Tax=Salinibacter ruber TaxID=146919 RepID=UPI00216846E7|nr:restriction endonuclease PLD domain-containing protein [Salinibacter ruber]MCS3831124.1 hypothetical protein [Salinibacter ruber]
MTQELPFTSDEAATEGVVDFSTEIVRSWRSFESYFEQADRLWAVSYCDTPQVVLDLFDTYGLKELELVAGNAGDYRERLTDEDAGLVGRLEQLRREQTLQIYTCPRKTVHSKLYILGQDDGPYTLITGSANLTKNSWTNHTNHLAVWRAQEESEIFKAFWSDYQSHVEDYGEPFLEDLTDRLDETEEEERAAVIRRWVAGRSTQRDEIEEITAKLADKVTDQPAENGDPSGDDSGNDETEIRLSLNGYSESTEGRVKDEVQTIGGTTGPDSVSMETGQIGDFLKRQFGVPGMWTEDRNLYFAPPEGNGRVLSSQLPEEPGHIDQALGHLEQFLSTVDRHGQTNEPQAVKAHMLETLLYFLWAPFANEHARAYLREGVSSLDKRLPFLYLQGESNSGKGTLLSFGLRLISGGAVTSPLDADDIGMSEVRRARKAHSSFPLAVDDIEKGKIRQLGPLRNYWSDWEPGRRFPTLIFTSNDRRPKEWFRNRSKMLSLNVMFDPGPAAEGEVQRLIQKESPLFSWISCRLLHRFKDGKIEMTGDVLTPVRKALFELYGRSGRTPPDYLGMVPAEDRFDAAQQEWRRLAREGRLGVRRSGEKLYVTFEDEMEHWEIGEFKRKLPTKVRPDQEGKRVVIQAPEHFKEWMGGDLPSGWLSRLKGLFR